MYALEYAHSKAIIFVDEAGHRSLIFSLEADVDKVSQHQDGSQYSSVTDHKINQKANFYLRHRNLGQKNKNLFFRR
jgi:hypothetical protein